MTTTRERAARALYEREPIFYHPSHPPFKIGQMPWEEADEGWRAPYYARVDAVLDAIREPGAQLLEHVAMFGFRETHGGPVAWATLPAADRTYHTVHTSMLIERLIDAIKQGEG